VPASVPAMATARPWSSSANAFPVLQRPPS